MTPMRRSSCFLLLLILAVVPAFSQAGAPGGPAGLRSVTLSGPIGAETAVTGVMLTDGSRETFPASIPLFSLLVGGRPATASALPAGLVFTVTSDDGFRPGAKLSVVFRNAGKAKV